VYLENTCLGTKQLPVIPSSLWTAPVHCVGLETTPHVPNVTINQIQTDLEADRRWRERCHQQWTENYELCRDTVITNRLTRRQSVNVPLMKATIRTLLSRAGEPADEDYENDGVREMEFCSTGTDCKVGSDTGWESIDDIQ
jgi:hypothetical protein